MKHCLCLGFCIAITGAAQLHAASDKQIVVDNTINENYRDTYLDSITFDDECSGIGGPHNGFEDDQKALAVGYIFPDKLEARNRKGVLFFRLPPLELRQKITQAKLSLYLGSKKNPDSQAASLGQVIVYGIRDNNSASPTKKDFTRGIALGKIADPDSPERTTILLDVTSAVTEDYQHDQEEPVSCFRLEMDNAKAFYAESASAANCYTFPGGNSRSEYIPKLLLTCAVWPPRLRCLAYA